MPVPTIQSCRLCGNPRQVRQVTIGVMVHDAAMCNICDVRKCEQCKHYAQDVYAKKCPNCGNRF